MAEMLLLNMAIRARISHARRTMLAVLRLPIGIRLDEGQRRFNYRVVGVAIHDGSVLLHRAGDEPFWALPGGRAEIGETAEETLKREMREELSTEVDVLRLLWLVENFFEYDRASYHEVALYFLMRFPPGSRPLAATAFDATDGGVTLRFCWVPVDEPTLARLPLFPSFLATGLGQLPASVTHVVHRDAPIQPPAHLD